MRRRAKIGTGTTILLLCCLLAAAPRVGGVGRNRRCTPGRDQRGEWVDRNCDRSDDSLLFCRGCCCLYSQPNRRGIGDAIAASRDTFSSAETIEFNGVLLESGLAGTTRNLALYLFDLRGGLASGPFLLNNVVAPDDRTDFSCCRNPDRWG
ncbi:MAG: hypothetical protein M5R38_08240 [Candidatus Methylomirabilis sp.]|nr:hypothetical protein [Candidatus Methylomirabilis sp.]